MIRVAIVDDHNLVRAGISQLLNSMRNIEVVGQAENGKGAFEIVKENSPDVLLLDVDLPDMDGLEVAAKLLQQYPDLKIMILTMFNSDELASRALQIGAKGYIIKGIDPDDLPGAIQTVADGNLYLTPSIKDKILMKQFSPGKDKSPLSQLSERERQVLIEIARGIKLKDIAEKLMLSQSTIKTHKKRISDKLGFNNISDFVQFAIRHDLIPKY